MNAFRQTCRAFAILAVLVPFVGCTETGLEPRLEEPIPAPRYAALTMGETYACALDVEGRAFCWGSNDYGELGIGSSGAGSITPVPVGGGDRFAAIDAGWARTCGVTTDGELMCWGSMDFNPRTLPVPVGPEGVSFRTVSVAGGYSCALTTDDRAFCAGVRTAWTEVPRLRWSRISTSHDHICGVTLDGAGYCWGENFRRQLGRESPSWSAEPVRAPGNETWTDLVAGVEYTCGSTTSGGTPCWGSVLEAALGTDTIPEEEAWAGVAVPIPLAGGALSVDELRTSGEAGSSYRAITCGIAELGGRSGGVCWGDYSPPIHIGFGVYHWASLQAGVVQGCGLTTDGRILCWDPVLVEPYQTRLLHRDIEIRELPAPIVEWRDS